MDLQEVEYGSMEWIKVPQDNVGCWHLWMR